VDPLRAGRVILLEDGFRYLCDAECHRRFREGERDHDALRRRPSPPAPAPVRRDPSTGVIRPGDARALPPIIHRPAPLTAPAVPAPYVGLGAAAVAVGLGALGASPGFAIASAGATWVAAGAALVASAGARRDVGLMAWLLGPLGAALAGLAALDAVVVDPAAWTALSGAGVAAAAMVVRAWLDAESHRPVTVATRTLTQTLPPTVRIATATPRSPVDVTFEEVETHRVRAGEEVLAVEGEVIAVDGVVAAGEAWVLTHRGAAAPVRRQPGDPVVAGAKVTDGAVRIVATRVGADRAMARPARFGDGGRHDASPLARLVLSVTRWGGIAALGAAAGGVILASGAAVQMAAAAAVLLAAPLFALRRSAELPLVAGAAAAAARGILFENARTLDTAGRVTVAALCARGTVTEGALEVVEVHPIGDADPDALIGVAAEVEVEAADHPIGLAIRRFAEAHGAVPEGVRRATLVPGQGLTALTSNGEPFVIGNRRLLLAEGVSVALADAEAQRAESHGYTALFIARGGRVRAVVSLQDTVKPGARAAVQRLFDLGVEVVLLSGDHRPAVEVLARTIDIANVRAELLPSEQGEEVRRLREAGGAVAVVGRVPHDETALAAADVAVVSTAAGAALSEHAVALATDDARDAGAALWIARAARGAAFRAVASSVGLGGLLLAIVAVALPIPAVAALAGLAIDVFALRGGARLLRRIDLRVPVRA
jgi:P-type E1-E2 ATPase